MKNGRYVTITGRTLSVRELSDVERRFLASVYEKYRATPEWSEFGAWWIEEFQEAGLEAGSAAYRICQDLEARLGIAQEKVAPPDYRDYLADLIEERYGSRYRFCKETGVDPGQLSRVLSSRSDLSLRSLQALLHKAGAALVVQRQEQVSRTASPERAMEDLASMAS